MDASFEVITGLFAIGVAVLLAPVIQAHPVEASWVFAGLASLFLVLMGVEVMGMGLWGDDRRGIMLTAIGAMMCMGMVWFLHTRVLPMVTQ